MLRLYSSSEKELDKLLGEYETVMQKLRLMIDENKDRKTPLDKEWFRYFLTFAAGYWAGQDSHVSYGHNQHGA